MGAIDGAVDLARDSREDAVPNRGSRVDAVAACGKPAMIPPAVRKEVKYSLTITNNNAVKEGGNIFAEMTETGDADRPIKLVLGCLKPESGEEGSGAPNLSRNQVARAFGLSELPDKMLLPEDKLKWQKQAVANLIWPEELLECSKGSKTHRSVLLLQKQRFDWKVRLGSFITTGSAVASWLLRKAAVVFRRIQIPRLRADFVDRILHGLNQARWAHMKKTMVPKGKIDINYIPGVVEMDPSDQTFWAMPRGSFVETITPPREMVPLEKFSVSYHQKASHVADRAIHHINAAERAVEDLIGRNEYQAALSRVESAVDSFGKSVESGVESGDHVMSKLSKWCVAAAVAAGSLTIALMCVRSSRWWASAKIVRRIETQNNVDLRVSGLSHTEIHYPDPQLAEVEMQSTLYLLDKVPIWWTTRQRKVVSLELFSHLLGNNVLGYGLGNELVENKTAMVIKTTHDINHDRYLTAEMLQNIGENTGILSVGFHKKTADDNLYWLGKRQTPVIA